MLSRSQRIRRGFQWLSVVLAAALRVVGLILITFDVLELDPWHVQQKIPSRNQHSFPWGAWPLSSLHGSLGHSSSFGVGGGENCAS